MKDRILEVAICIESFIILVLFTVVLYFIIEYNVPPRQYDINKDGNVDIYDLLEEVDRIEAMKEYIIEN